jgi:hypothetical protein
MLPRCASPRRDVSRSQRSSCLTLAHVKKTPPSPARLPVASPRREGSPERPTGVVASERTIKSRRPATFRDLSHPASNLGTVTWDSALEPGPSSRAALTRSFDANGRVRPVTRLEDLTNVAVGRSGDALPFGR